MGEVEGETGPLVWFTLVVGIAIEGERGEVGELNEESLEVEEGDESENMEPERWRLWVLVAMGMG